MQLGGVLSTSQVANSFMGTGFSPELPEKKPDDDEPPPMGPMPPPETAVPAPALPVPAFPATAEAAVMLTPGPMPGGLQPPIALAMAHCGLVGAAFMVYL